jgi:hypothetical protein
MLWPISSQIIEISPARRDVPASLASSQANAASENFMSAVMVIVYLPISANGRSQALTLGQPTILPAEAQTWHR